MRVKVTRKDVARYAGVSTAVVSYVVNGGPRNVAPETADRVRQAIDVLQYEPDANARALSLGSARMLGLVVPDLTTPFYAELGVMIAEKAESRGFAVLTASSGTDAATEKRTIQGLVSRTVDAMIIASASPQESATSSNGSIRRVLIDQAVPVPGFACVSTDFDQAVRLAVDHLLEHGHRTVSLIVGGLGSHRAVDPRELAWGDALDRAGRPRGPVIRVGFTREDGYSAMRELLTGERPPTAVFTSSDLQAVGALKAIHEAGLRVPDDIAVVSFDGSAESEFTWPALTTVKQNTDAIADLAVSAALDGEPGDGPSLVPAHLVIRDSCGCRPASMARPRPNHRGN